MVKVRIYENEILSDRELDRKIKSLKDEKTRRKKEKAKETLSKYIGSLLDLVY